jgi:hypothetical protein
VVEDTSTREPALPDTKPDRGTEAEEAAGVENALLYSSASACSTWCSVQQEAGQGVQTNEKACE